MVISVRLDLQAIAPNREQVADGHHIVELVGVLVLGFGDKAVPLINAVKLNPNTLLDVGPQGRACLETGFGVDAFGKAGFRALVLTGKADAQVEDRGLDLEAVRSQVVDELSGRGKAFLNDARVSLNVVDIRFTRDVVNVQIRLEHGLEVVRLFGLRQKCVDVLCDNFVVYVPNGKI